MTLQYIVIMDDNLRAFEKNVTQKLNDGWKLQGGVSISVSEDEDSKFPYYAQAMIVDLEVASAT